MDPCELCGYRPRAKDAHWIDEWEVLHVICYDCGHEWVE